VFKPNFVQIHTKIRVYKTSAQFMLTYGSEAWTVYKRDEGSIKAAEMEFMRRRRGYTRLDYKKSLDIMKK